MKNERTASYMGGLVYKKKVTQKAVIQPIASHLTLLKEKIKRQETSSLQIPSTSSTPDKNLIDSPHSCHMEHHLAH
jgi:hypothetical protein